MLPAGASCASCPLESLDLFGCVLRTFCWQTHSFALFPGAQRHTSQVRRALAPAEWQTGAWAESSFFEALQQQCLGSPAGSSWPDLDRGRARIALAIKADRA